MKKNHGRDTHIAAIRNLSSRKDRMAEPKNLEDAFKKICDELLATFIKKHKDYGKGNILSLQELGIAFRETEKVERLKNLLMKSDGKPANESIEDTWTDVAVYAIIAQMYRREWFQKLEAKKD
jgi:hypothetical protein